MRFSVCSQDLGMEVTEVIEAIGGHISTIQKWQMANETMASHIRMSV